MLLFLSNYFKQAKKKILIFSILNMLIAFISAVVPLISGNFIDSLVSSHDYQIIIKFIIILCLFVFAQLSLGYVVQVQEAVLQAHLTYNIQKDILNQLQKTQIYLISQYDLANLSQRISSDSSSISSFMISSGSSLLVCCLNFFFSTILLFIVKWEIALFILVFLVLYILYFYKLQNNLTVKQKDVKNDFSYYFSQIFSQLKNLKNLKIFSLYNYYGISLFDSYNKYIYSLKKFKIFSFRLTSGDTLLAFFAQIVIFIFGGVSVINGNMTIGIFSVLLSYFNMMLNSIKYIPSLTSSYAEMFASYSRITELINLEKDNTGKLKYSDNNFLEIKNLTYKYPGSNTYLFSKFNYSFQKGNIYCLKGRNGSGKTTLLDIISKLKFSYNGSIELNQRNIELFDTKYYRDVCLSYMTQDAFVIKAGLKDNILSQNLSEKLSTLIQELGLEKYIDSNYNINTKISGGEKQKISFLRSITKPFNILLLDEPTNHLDFISKEILMKYLNNIKNDAIIIISSHDNFVLERVDTIIDLNKS